MLKDILISIEEEKEKLVDHIYHVFFLFIFKSLSFYFIKLEKRVRETPSKLINYRIKLYLNFITKPKEKKNNYNNIYYKLTITKNYDFT